MTQHTADTITQIIRANTFGIANEAELEQALIALLEAAGVKVEAQVRLTPQDRIDLVAHLAAGARLGIEIKVKGDAGAVRSQLIRYSRSDMIDALLIVTTQRRHLINLPTVLGAKPLHRLLVRCAG